MKNTNKNYKVVTATPIEVQTYAWSNYGNQIVCKFAALNEIIQNAISAIIRYTTLCATGNARYFVENRIDVSIKKRKTGTYLYVQNNGIPADLKKVLDYGRINRDTALNQHGTGFKTAASFFNPANDGWAFYTRDAEHIYRVMAPYSTEMHIEEIEEWPFDEWAVSCVEIKVSDEIDMSDITAKELGYRYSFAINNGINLTFNRTIVRPVMPKAIHTDRNSFEKTINGETVQFEYLTCIVDDTEAKYYAKTEVDQGIYIFVNDCFVENSGVSLIHKRNKGGGKLKKHPSMNGMICLVNICLPDNHKVNIPFANTKNAINWEKAEVIAQIIDEKVGKPFYDAYKKHLEDTKRAIIDEVCSKFSRRGLYYYAQQVEVGNKIKADAVFYKEQNPDGSIVMESVDTVIEFKTNKVTGADVGQGLNYFINLNECYPASFKRRLMFVGPEISDDAWCFIRNLRAAGYEIDVYTPNFFAD